MKGKMCFGYGGLSFIVFFIFVMVGSTFAADEKSDKLISNIMFRAKCAVCHSDDRSLNKQKSKEEWLDTVKRMQQKDPKSIDDEYVEEIVRFLASKSLFDSKCLSCHGAEKARSKRMTKSEWESLTKKMQKKKGHSMTDDERKMISDYLFNEHGRY